MSKQTPETKIKKYVAELKKLKTMWDDLHSLKINGTTIMNCGPALQEVHLFSGIQEVAGIFGSEILCKKMNYSSDIFDAGLLQYKHYFIVDGITIFQLDDKEDVYK